MDNKKRFFTYDEQIQHLINKKMSISEDEKTEAINILKKCGYYALVSAYKDLFKIERNGNYKENTKLSYLYAIYQFDQAMRSLFIEYIMMVERHIKSLYTYNFCVLYGDSEENYLNVNNYNYSRYQSDVNNLVEILKAKSNSDKPSYIKYNKDKYNSVPLWVLANSLTLGNISKMYFLSEQKLQSTIAREFPNVYSRQLSKMLSTLTKFRNVCAHNERLYCYKVQTSIPDMPIHKSMHLNPKGKNDLFSVIICLKYLLPKLDFIHFITNVSACIDKLEYSYNMIGAPEYPPIILEHMGFPDNWQNIPTIN